MPSLELAVQSQGVKTGGAETRAELDQIIQKSKDTEKAVGQVGQTSTTTGASMREAFGAGRGGLNLARGLQGITDSLGGVVAGTKDLSQVGLVTAGVMMQLGRTADDWRQLSTAVTVTQKVVREATHDVFGINTGFRDVVQTQRNVTTGWAALGTVMRAHPIMTAAGVVTTLTGAMALFSAATSKAEDEWSKLADSMERAKLNQRASSFLNISQTPALKQQLDILYQGTSASMRGETGTVDALAAASGMSRMDVLRFLASNGNSSASEYMKRGEFNTGRRLFNPYPAPGQGEMWEYSTAAGGIPVSGSQQQALFGSAYEGMTRRMEANRGLDMRRPSDPFKSNVSYPDLGNYFAEEDEMARMDGYQMKFWEKPEEKTKESMTELVALGRELHSTFADAGSVLLMNLNQSRAILRDMANTMLQSILRTGISKATEGLFTGFGRTPAQVSGGNGALGANGLE